MVKIEFHSTAASSEAHSLENGVSPPKSRDSQGLLPLTVNQIHQCALGEITNVRIVGTVFNVVEKFTGKNPMEVTFELDDGDGSINCYGWIENDEDKETMEEKMAKFKFLGYAEIQGHLKAPGVSGSMLVSEPEVLKDFELLPGKHMQLEVFSVRRVTNLNQVAHRFMKYGRDTKFQGHDSNPNAAITNGSSSYQTAPSNQFSGQPSSDDDDDDDNGDYEKVLEVIRSLPLSKVPDKGLHYSELTKNIELSAAKIMKALGTLEEEGLVYSTIDEFHYKPIFDN